MSLSLTAVQEVAYFSPEEDVKAPFLAFVRSATRSIHISIFGFHIPELTDALIERHRAGVDVSLIFDHSQAQGKAEAPELAKLQAAGVPFLIGTSWVEGQLLHAKVTIVDGEWVEDGSWNYSESASKQDNSFRITRSPQLAHFYLRNFDIVRAYIIHHERIFQPTRAKTPAPALAEDAGRDAELDPAPNAGQVRRADTAKPWLDNAPLPKPAPPVPANSGKRSARKSAA
jgi:phosphatidylserine/phosphatidylglycerophosphate/cardiolipin synthase-like enzyme